MAKIYIIMKPAKSQIKGDAIKSASIGATCWEISHFKYYLYISYEETI